MKDIDTVVNIEDKVDEPNEKKILDKIISLRSLNLKVNKGKFICIIGEVGSGKSSFLSSLIGDLRHLN